MMTLLKKIYHKLNRGERPGYHWSIREKAIRGRGLSRYLNLHKWNKLMHEHGAGIPVTASIAGKPSFPHGFYGIFISSGAVIGKNCTIFHQVTIGSNTLAGTKKPGAPVIGDNVYIGAGAKIIGGIRVGNNVRIGANCVVTKDIPDNSTVVLSSPRLIEREEAPDNTFTSWIAFDEARQKTENES